MRRLLLDTHALLWWLADDSRLGSVARDSIADERNTVCVSAASVWEISIKRQLGKLKAPDDLERIIDEEGFLALPITAFHAEQAGNLPLHHRDPFDRMLIAQAQAEGLTLISADGAFTAYGIRFLQA